MGVAKIFTPGSPTTDIVAWVRAELGHEVQEGPEAAAAGRG
jgi:methylmalonyl-CoA mutase cobalamin-binding subunit